MVPSPQEQELLKRKIELEQELEQLEKALVELKKMVPLDDLSERAREIVRSMYANGWKTEFELTKERTLWTFSKILLAKNPCDAASRIEGADADIMAAARRACLGAREIFPSCLIETLAEPG